MYPKVKRLSINPRANKTPLVEAITKHPGEWEVFGNNTGIAYTDNEIHRMLVPTDDLPCRCHVTHDAAVRLHESLHAKLSPEKPEAATYLFDKEKIEIPAELVVVAEEYRIGAASLLAAAGSITGTHAKDYVCQPGLRNAIFSYLEQGDYFKVITLGLSYGPTSFVHVGKNILEYRQKTKDWLRTTNPESDVYMATEKRLTAIEMFSLDYVTQTYDRAERILRSFTEPTKYPPWESTLALAAWLHRLKKDLEKQLWDDMNTAPDFERLLNRTPTPALPVTGSKGITITPTADTTGEIIWGEPYTWTAPLTEGLPAWKTQRHNRAIDEGTIPRYMHRWYVDKRVFHRTRRLPGGSILIDVSGSMSFSRGQLNELVEAAPASIIAIYTGQDSGPDGEICIVADDQKRAAEEYLHIDGYGGNGIDLPALEWLSQQSEPRIWVSDGGVSCWSHGFDKRATLECMEFCIKHNINLLQETEYATEALLGKRVLLR